MDQSFFMRMIPFYLFILLGFLSGKLFNAKKETLSSILIYILAPIIVFNGAFSAELSSKYLILPVFSFIICCLMCLLVYYISGFFWHDSHKNILAFSAGTGNTGYFGLPIAIALFGEAYLPIIVLILLGFIIYENTLGFFIAAKGSHTLKESLNKLLKLPSIYAFLFGIAFNAFNVNGNFVYFDAVNLVKGAYSVFGMMIIGVAMSEITDFKIDFKFTGFAFLIKFLAWPLIIYSLVSLDTSYFMFFSKEIHNSMILLSLVPMAANTVSYAAELNVQPKKAAFAVFLSTIFALIYIPVMTSILL